MPTRSVLRPMLSEAQKEKKFTCAPKPHEIYTRKCQEHEPSSFGYYVEKTLANNIYESLSVKSLTWQK